MVSAISDSCVCLADWLLLTRHRLEHSDTASWVCTQLGNIGTCMHVPSRLKGAYELPLAVLDSRDIASFLYGGELCSQCQAFVHIAVQ